MSDPRNVRRAACTSHCGGQATLEVVVRLNQQISTCCGFGLRMDLFCMKTYMKVLDASLFEAVCWKRIRKRAHCFVKIKAKHMYCTDMHGVEGLT